MSFQLINGKVVSAQERAQAKHAKEAFLRVSRTRRNRHRRIKLGVSLAPPVQRARMEPTPAYLVKVDRAPRPRRDLSDPQKSVGPAYHRPRSLSGSRSADLNSRATVAHRNWVGYSIEGPADVAPVLPGLKPTTSKLLQQMRAKDTPPAPRRAWRVTDRPAAKVRPYSVAIEVDGKRTYETIHAVSAADAYNTVKVLIPGAPIYVDGVRMN